MITAKHTYATYLHMFGSRQICQIQLQISIAESLLLGGHAIAF